MSSTPIKKVTGKGVFVPGDDIDTDRIIPARFMKCITFDGLGEYLFHDVRKTESGEDKKHNLNDSRFAGASILVSGNNFGCGSSREHAPQSILRAGYDAVIAGSFAEIFFGNSTNLGVVCVIASDADREIIASAIETHPELEITIDVETTRSGMATNLCPVRSSQARAIVCLVAITTHSTNSSWGQMKCLKLLALCPICKRNTVNESS